MKISAVIITFNEEINIGRCLESLRDVADEIIVVDSFSTDNTKTICADFGVKFLEHAFEGHIQQKNWAWQQASHEYVLSLDADEALDATLTSEILRVKSRPKHRTYKMNRLTNYCGKWIRHGSWYPDRKLRLARKDAAIWAGENPHDKLTPLDGKKAHRLKGDILHYSYYSVDQHIEQQQKFSSIAAQAMFNRGKKAPLFKLFVNPMASIIKDLFIRQGFLDGWSGFVIAYISAKSVFWKYSKLRQLYKTGKLA
jgi:glycosyltransferase involved in cell wall biosynthesis